MIERTPSKSIYEEEINYLRTKGLKQKSEGFKNPGKRLDIKKRQKQRCSVI